jgi:hypothetical protein
MAVPPAIVLGALWLDAYQLAIGTPDKRVQDLPVLRG